MVIKQQNASAFKVDEAFICDVMDVITKLVVRGIMSGEKMFEQDDRTDATSP